jgi:hypothetical protein
VSVSNVIEVKTSNKRDIATVFFDENNKPKLKNIEVKKYEEDLERILNSIGDAKLSLALLPRSKKGSKIISDRVKYCSQKDEDYVYALARELSFYKLSDGVMIRGVVTPEKE